jgi:hypothetical protein
MPCGLLQIDASRAIFYGKARRTRLSNKGCGEAMISDSAAEAMQMLTGLLSLPNKLCN